MIDIIICSKNSKLLNKCVAQIQRTAALQYHLIVLANHQNQYSLAQAYNQGIRESKSDYLIFMHEDVFYLSPGWDHAVVSALNTLPKIGILGVAGTNYLDQTAQWYAYGAQHTRGRVFHRDQQSAIWESVFGENSGEAASPVVVVDGLWMACHKKLVKESNLIFDESYNGFHFYDLSWSAAVFLNGYINYVTHHIPLLHLGLGDLTDDWEKNRRQFIAQFSDRFPLRTSPDIQFTPPPIPIVKKSVQDLGLRKEMLNLLN